MTRLDIAVKLLKPMLASSGSKENKVKAALEYADLLIEESKRDVHRDGMYTQDINSGEIFRTRLPTKS